MTGRHRILVIKLSALGDVVQALGPAAAIRRYHPDAEIVLLTTAPYSRFLSQAPYFDAVWTDERPGPFDLAGLWRLRRRLRSGGFSRVYDLQTSSRSSQYFWAFAPRFPEWSGIARGASHRHARSGQRRESPPVRQDAVQHSRGKGARRHRGSGSDRGR